jgi:hypothetical protein
MKGQAVRSGERAQLLAAEYYSIHLVAFAALLD